MSLLDPESAEYVELMQEINKRFRNKNMLYKYLTEKTVSKPTDPSLTILPLAHHAP